MSNFASELSRRLREQSARELEAAEQAARESGKELFDMEKLVELLGGTRERRGPNEADLREMYYVSYPEIRTLAEFAELRRMLWYWE